MEAGVEEEHFAFARASEAAQAMSGGTPFAGRAESGGAQEAAKGFATERETFDLIELLLKMMIVEASVAGARQGEDALAQTLGQAAWAGTPAADVSQSRCAALPIAGFETFDVPSR
jgi:hypothetical protein